MSLVVVQERARNPALLAEMLTIWLQVSHESGQPPIRTVVDDIIYLALMHEHDALIILGGCTVFGHDEQVQGSWRNSGRGWGRLGNLCAMITALFSGSLGFTTEESEVVEFHTCCLSSTLK